MNLKFLKSGLQTTIQDLGRVGYRELGIASNGVLDEYSHRFANWLVGQPSHFPTIEITHIGPTIEFSDALTIGVSGANFKLSINDCRVPMNHTLHMKAGDRLEFGSLNSGARAYLAISGTMKIPKVMASYSTNLFAEFGGTNGKAIADGDVLKVEPKAFDLVRRIPQELSIEHHHNLQQNHLIIRCTEGREFSVLKASAKQQFLKENYEVTSYSNRMALKLKGIELETELEESLTTAPIVAGTIQLPPSGLPIITLADGQTTGGYPRIGQVISADMSLLAQLKPHDTVSFYPVSVEQAKSLLLQKEEYVNHILNS